MGKSNLDKPKHLPAGSTMRGNDKTTGQGGKANLKLPTLRRGAVSVQSPDEYKKLKPHKNVKDKLLQYVGWGHNKAKTNGGDSKRSTK
jgi:hypothetical protein